jgi:hypothetical protein
MHPTPLRAHGHVRFTERQLPRTAHAERLVDVALQDLVPGPGNSVHQIFIARQIQETGPFTAIVRRLLS